jgi:hypothetical protein
LDAVLLPNTLASLTDTPELEQVSDDENEEWEDEEGNVDWAASEFSDDHLDDDEVRALQEEAVRIIMGYSPPPPAATNLPAHVLPTPSAPTAPTGPPSVPVVVLSPTAQRSARFSTMVAGRVRANEDDTRGETHTARDEQANGVVEAHGGADAVAPPALTDAALLRESSLAIQEADAVNERAARIRLSRTDEGELLSSLPPSIAGMSQLTLHAARDDYTAGSFGSFPATRRGAGRWRRGT